MYRFAKAVLVAAVVLLPTLVHAQSLAGTVRDASGAVLPGVTIEATSPALLEKVRTAITDGTGQYRLENLVPGVYTVSFSLAGFVTVRREGVDGSETQGVQPGGVPGAGRRARHGRRCARAPHQPPPRWACGAGAGRRAGRADRGQPGRARTTPAPGDPRTSQWPQKTSRV